MASPILAVDSLAPQSCESRREASSACTRYTAIDKHAKEEAKFIERPDRQTKGRMFESRISKKERPRKKKLVGQMVRSYFRRDILLQDERGKIADYLKANVRKLAS